MKPYYSFSTWEKFNSRGVFLPKIFTITFSFFFSSFTSSMIAEKLLNGPSITLTGSPTMKGSAGRSGESASSSTLLRIR